VNVPNGLDSSSGRDLYITLCGVYQKCGIYPENPMVSNKLLQLWCISTREWCRSYFVLGKIGPAQLTAKKEWYLLNGTATIIHKLSVEKPWSKEPKMTLCIGSNQ